MKHFAVYRFILFAVLTVVGGSFALWHSIDARTVAYEQSASPISSHSQFRGIGNESGVSTAAASASNSTNSKAATTPTTLAPVKTSSTAAVTATKTTVVPAKTVSVSEPAYVNVPKNLYIDSTNGVYQAIESYAQTDPASAGSLAKITSEPMAKWFGGWSGAIANAVSSYVTAAAQSAATPVLVAYNIPDRDCGGASAGGASDAGSYAAWISGFTNGLGQEPAIVILEPDAVSQDCFDSGRASILASAINTLKTDTNARVYLDAGNPTWRTVSDMKTRLQSAGINNADGFSLNVSNFQSTSSNIDFGTSLSSALDGKHYVIDTSRNGSSVSATTWCNPDNQLLGTTPTMNTGISKLDAELWIKNPGESDGSAASDASCDTPSLGESAPTAGTFWPAYAEMLAR
jgi:endoglucanase